VLWNKEAYGTLSHFSPGCTNVEYNFVSIPQHYAIKNIQDFYLVSDYSSNGNLIEQKKYN